ncbi:hypothetical protein MKW92_051081 [Papaver armeniacum]|nr:hypothetical protein MKW92_051081 [Papaver armeniacum]
MNTDQTKKTWSSSVIGELDLTEPKREEEYWKESIFELRTFVKDRNVKPMSLKWESYARQLHEEWAEDNRFVELMIQDGCFILEFLAAAANYHEINSYALNDPMFSYHVLALHKVNRVLSWMMFAPNEGPGLHLLDMYMEGLLRGGKQFEEIVVKRCASELHYQSGVQFNKVGSYQGIKFDKNIATLQLSSIIINDYNASTLLNLLAYELRVGTGRDELFSSPGSDKAVVKVLKELARDKVVDSSCKSCVVVEEMNKYCFVIGIYFSNPWTSISVAGAAFLLALTVIQTIYTVLSFYSDHPLGKKK